MRKLQKNQIISTIGLLEKAHDAIKKAMDAGNPDAALTLLEQCQDSAIQIGGMIEESEGEGFATVELLENYCELLYLTYESIRQQQPVNVGKTYKNLRRELIRIENSVKNDIPVRTSAVFLPYKASMWDSLESVWKAADADPDCDAYVVPIPYFDKNPDGSFSRMHYEGELYPEYVPIVSWEAFDLEKEHPDVIYIHNPYDECNHVTSVHPFFYARELRKFTDKLVYISYFILGEEMYESMCVTPGTVFSDVVIAHSASAKEDYYRYLKKFYMENADIREIEVDKMLQGKILPLGSPKIDKVVNGKREDYELPAEWQKRLDKKKAVLYNTGVSGILRGNEQELKKIKDTIVFFSGRDDVVLWWRPHPLTGGTIQSMRPKLFEEYLVIVEEYKQSGIGIYDDTADLHRAVLWTDMYYGDDSSLIYLYGVQGKPIMRQNIGVLTEQTASKPGHSICYKAACHVNDSIFFTALNYNRFYRLDLVEKSVTDLGAVPQEWQMEISLYSNVIYKDDTLWLVPSRAHALAAYHLNTGRWERYELPDRIKSSTRIEEKIYMISSDYKCLWVMNLEEKRLEREVISYRKEEEIPLSEEYYDDDLYVVGNQLYYLITHTNMLASYDLESKRAEFMHIGSEKNIYQRMLRDDKGFWLFPRDEKTRIAYWDGVNLKESGSCCYPPGFELQWGFSHAVFENESILLFPVRGNMVLRLDTETMETTCEMTWDGGIDTHSVCMLQDGRMAFSYISTLKQRDSRVMILGADSKPIDDYPVLYLDRLPADASSMFEKMGVEKYNAADVYQIGETGEYALSYASDALVKGKAVYKAEQDYFRSLYANSDGTAGLRIWEEVKP